MRYRIRRVAGAALAVSVLGLTISTADWINDAPKRAQYDRCIDNGGGSLCEGLVTD